MPSIGSQGRLVTKNTVTPAARAASTNSFTPWMGVAAVLRVHSSSFQFSNGRSNVSWKSMLLTTVSSTSRMTATGSSAALSWPGMTLQDVSSMKPGRSRVAAAYTCSVIARYSAECFTHSRPPPR
jgi:hypothetical protein